MEKKICSRCKKKKLLNEFYSIKKKYENQTVFHTARCRKCTNEINVKNSKKYKRYYKNYRDENKDRIRKRNRKYHKERKEKWKEFISHYIDLKCSECGYDKSFAALDFHHRNSEEKEYGIDKLLKGALTKERKNILLNEIKKCDILCSNCHRELHYEINKIFE